MKTKQLLIILIAVLMSLSIAQWALAADAELAATGPAGASSESEAALAELMQSIEADKSTVVGDLVDRFATDDVTARQLAATLAGASTADLAEIVENADSLEAVNTILAGPEDILRLGDLTRDYAFTPVTPCRIVDTRIAGGAFSPGQAREFYVYGTDVFAQGGAGNCPSPGGEPRGVHLNMTAVPLAGNGNFRVYPADVSPPNASFVNYRAGVQNVANAGSVKTFFTVGPREIEVLNSFGNSHLVIDVLGYYYETEHLAGADFAASSDNEVTLGAPATVKLVSITAPASGKVIVNASGYFRLASGANDTARCSISSAANTAIDFSHLIIVGENSGTAMTFVPFAATRGFNVGAGTTTFRLNCDLFSGTVSVGDPTINATWVPRTY